MSKGKKEMVGCKECGKKFPVDDVDMGLFMPHVCPKCEEDYK